MLEETRSHKVSNQYQNLFLPTFK